MVNSEERNASSDRKDNDVLRKGVSSLKKSDVEEHNRQQFARFSKDKIKVVDVGERGIAEGRSQRGCQAD